MLVRMLAAMAISSLAWESAAAAVPAPAYVIFPGMRVALVNSVPGDPLASGTALLNALAAISPSCPDDHWVVKVLPGVFDVGTGTLAMKPCADIEGSGQLATTIRASGHPPGPGLQEVVSCATDAELRMLTVHVPSIIFSLRSYAIRCAGTSTRMTQISVVMQSVSEFADRAVQIESGSTVVMEGVTASASSAIGAGLHVFGGSVAANNSSFSGGARGARVTGGSVTMKEVEIVGGLTVSGGTVAVHRSRVDAGTTVLAGTLGIGASQVSGPMVHSGGTLLCFGNYDAGFAPVTCPP